DTLYEMDKSKAIRLVIYGLILVMICLAVMSVSRAVAGQAYTWRDLMNAENQNNYWGGLYGMSEYLERMYDITKTYNWMLFQQVIFVNAGRVGLYISLIVMVVGFFGLALNSTMDQKTRLIFLILASVILIIMLFGVFFSSISLNVYY
nr:hypothetical protein [Candidatus Sigynarchaeota archaeon]